MVKIKLTNIRICSLNSTQSQLNSISTQSQLNSISTHLNLNSTQSQLKLLSLALLNSSLFHFLFKVFIFVFVQSNLLFFFILFLFSLFLYFFNVFYFFRFFKIQNSLEGALKWLMGLLHFKAL